MPRLYSWLYPSLWLVSMTLSGAQAQAQNLVRLASDNWCPYICSDGRDITDGLLVDVAREALTHAGYQVEPALLPLNRAMFMLEKGRIEGLYAPKIDPRLANSRAVMESRACFYTLPNNSWRYDGLPSLGKVTVASSTTMAMTMHSSTPILPRLKRRTLKTSRYGSGPPAARSISRCC